MKTTVFVFIASLIASLTQAQKIKESEVPLVVKESFGKRFSNAKEVKWSKESATEFEAEFKTGEMEQSANFDQSGKWLVTETEIKSSQLPTAVQATIAKEFAGYKVKESEKAETFDDGFLYEVELGKGKMKFEVQISSNGKVLKKEEIKENKEEQD